SLRTMKTYMQDRLFKEELRRAQEQAREQTVTFLAKAGAFSVKTLLRNQKCGNPAVEVKAAQVIFEQQFGRRADLEELARQLAELRKEVGHGGDGGEPGAGSGPAAGGGPPAEGGGGAGPTAG